MPIATIPTRAFTEQNLSFKNIFINGDMSIAQRGTSAANISTGGYYTCDRWRISTSGATYEFSNSQSTDVPTGQGFSNSLKLDCTTAQADLGTSSHLYFEQKIEGQNLQYLKKGTANAESVTLSFWVKSNKTGTYSLTIFDYDNTRQIASTYTINTANTWEKKTVTFVGDTTGTLDNDNAVGLSVFFSLALGTNRTDGTLQTSWGSYVEGNWGSPSQVNLADSTDNEWYITGVQLEAGDTASDFEFLPYDVNLQRCLRYYFKDDCRLQMLTARVSDALRLANFRLPVPMRTAPTFTALASTEIGNTAVVDSSEYAITFQQSGSDGSIPRYTSFECKAEL